MCRLSTWKLSSPTKSLNPKGGPPALAGRGHQEKPTALHPTACYLSRFLPLIIIMFWKSSVFKEPNSPAPYSLLPLAFSAPHYHYVLEIQCFQRPQQPCTLQPATSRVFCPSLSLCSGNPVFSKTPTALHPTACYLSRFLPLIIIMFWKSSVFKDPNSPAPYSLLPLAFSAPHYHYVLEIQCFQRP